MIFTLATVDLHRRSNEQIQQEEYRGTSSYFIKMRDNLPDAARVGVVAGASLRRPLQRLFEQQKLNWADLRKADGRKPQNLSSPWPKSQAYF